MLAFVISRAIILYKNRKQNSGKYKELKASLESFKNISAKMCDMIGEVPGTFLLSVITLSVISTYLLLYPIHMIRTSSKSPPKDVGE